MVVRATERMPMQERNTGRGGRESDGHIARVSKKLHFRGVEEMGLQLCEKWLPSVASSEELSSHALK